MAWATVQQVTDLTGQTLTTTQIAMGQGIIELYADVTEAANDNLSPRDLRYLQMATAYQAVYMASNAHTDYFSRTAVDSLDQDGVKVTTTDRDAYLLGIAAKRALEKLSWYGSGSISTQSPTGRMSFEEYGAAWMRDEVPGTWLPLGY